MSMPRAIGSTRTIPTTTRNGNPTFAMTLLVASVASPCTSLPKCFPGLQFLSRNLREKGAEGKDYTLHLRLHQFLHPVAQAIPLRRVGCRTQRKQEAPWKKHQNGRERPHFFGFQPPKKFVGSLPPCGTVNRAGRFFHGDREFERNTHQPRRNTMPLVKKAPVIMTREVRLEEPVNELLEDYARFIESNPDHVINAVLKKVLWRDQDYRKWREARRTAQPGPDKTQPTEPRGRT